jgi:2-keto-4-pentenoate hydratase/2-oxohepta-3-ene-1,7-dioic acid hydratase in catechol pathway
LRLARYTTDPAPTAIAGPGEIIDYEYTAEIAIAARGHPYVYLDESWRRLVGVEDGEPPSSMLDLIAGGDVVELEILARRAADDVDLRVDESASGFRWLCPFDRIASLRDFLAFEDHVIRGAKRRGTEVPAYWYEAPVYYKGNHRALLGPDESCLWPAYTKQLDFELELAMIVGRGGRDIAAAGAVDHIFGFTIFNDFSARDVQARELTTWLGPAKGKDFANSFGPCIVTVDELGPEPDLEMVCRVNSDEWGRARSSSARWSWADMIAHVSAAEEIYPGDVYGSGTPGGCCGLDLGRELAPDDVIELEIENIGILRNQIIRSS